MKKMAILCFLLSSVVFANTIELTGKFSKELGNPFRVLYKKTPQPINIYSDDKDIILPVNTNLKYQDSITSRYPDRITLKNKSVENVVDNYFSEVFDVNRVADDAIKVNILSGKVYLNYRDTSSNIAAPILQSAEVELEIEITRDGKTYIEKTKLDNKLGKKKGDNYSFTITKDTFKLTYTNLDTTIQTIIEVSIYNALNKINQ